ncbi:MAG TPA: putative PEP-binding protein [Dehalococcoidia bacterium]
MTKKYVYLFHEGDKDQKGLLGGKGANLAEMTNLGLPVPPGLTITTEACNAYTANNMQLPDGLMDDVRAALATVEEAAGKRLGDAGNPLLVSVRSGAKFSMPGMMDTVLNLGLNAETLQGLIALTGDERFAYDAYRRFVMMFSDIVLDLERRAFDRMFDDAKREAGVKEDWQLSPDALKQVVERFKQHVKQETGSDFPEDPLQQLELAIRAVFDSWNNERAFHYREIEKIPHDLGTAVNVQTMVFGNMGADSGTGVAFTRDASTGENVISGEYLVNAQGEDVVAGIRNASPIAELRNENAPLYDQFADICRTLEQHFRDMMDVEFTFEKGRLYFLQCRVAKRATAAAVKIAVDMAHEGLISKEEALARVDPKRLDDLLHPQIDPRVKRIGLSEVAREVTPLLAKTPALVYLDDGHLGTVEHEEWEALTHKQREDRMHDLLGRAKFIDLASGLAASPGAAAGIAIFDRETAVRRGRANGGAGEDVILVREETSPDDVSGMTSSQGILTERGGMSSHAALVARGFGKPCVAGCKAITVDEEARSFSISGVTVPEGQVLTIDGSTGAVLLGAIPTVPPVISPEFTELLAWADEASRMKVRTNADNPADAAKAVELGAQGIGLCRTEHMFFGERLPIVREMLLAAASAKALQAETEALKTEIVSATGDKKAKSEQRLAEATARMRAPMERYVGALDQLLPMQQGDFEAIFRVMAGKPVTIRLIDPPMHEFLPDHDALLEEVTRLRIEQPDSVELRDAESLLASVNAVREQNPMLGLRGCRLGILYPEINEMQVKAIFRAAIKLAAEGISVLPEVMIPLVGFEAELKHLRTLLESTARKEMDAASRSIEYQFGTMIELPRAALIAGQLAETAEFFSFGTNDLTQTTLGFSRDDAESKFLGKYLQMGLLKENPFETIDQVGVGSLMRQAIQSGRETRPAIKLGICGEHGGDPASVMFCHTLGLSYVSCSPYRVPIARLAAAHAALQDVAQDR